MTPHPQNKGELEYGSILPNGDDWQLWKFDAGMGETEYRIFKNEKFFAQFDNREDADTVMVAMTHPYNPQAEREKVMEIVEILNSLCNIDLWQYVRGDKEGDDVGKCRGITCNYCGRYNTELREQGEQ